MKRPWDDAGQNPLWEDRTGQVWEEQWSGKLWLVVGITLDAVRLRMLDLESGSVDESLHWATLLDPMPCHWRRLA